MVGSAALGEDHGLARARGGTAHAIDLLGIGVGASDDTQQEFVSRRPGAASKIGQLIEAEEDALARATPHIGGRNAKLLGECLRHAQAALASRKSWANRCKTPPAS